MEVKIFKKIFSIIELLENKREMKLFEIASVLSMNKSTVYRIMKKLCEVGFVEKNSKTKSYKLGLRFLMVSRRILEDLDIRDIADKSLEELRKKTKETIHLALLMDNKAIYIDKKESIKPIRMYSEIGKVVPLYCTGVGKAILAFQKQDKLNELLDKIEFVEFTKNTITDRKDLLKELEKIRQQGFSIDNEEHEKNINCIASPIRNFMGEAIGGISITAISYHTSKDDLLSYKNLILEKSKYISRKLGYE